VWPGRLVWSAGLVVVRQRPETAHGITFPLLEDETGLANVIAPVAFYEAERSIVRTDSYVVITGRLERQGAVINLLARETERLDVPHFLAEAPQQERETDEGRGASGSWLHTQPTATAEPWDAAHISSRPRGGCGTPGLAVLQLVIARPIVHDGPTQLGVPAVTDRLPERITGAVAMVFDLLPNLVPGLRPGAAESAHHLGIAGMGLPVERVINGVQGHFTTSPRPPGRGGNSAARTLTWPEILGEPAQATAIDRRGADGGAGFRARGTPVRAPKPPQSWVMRWPCVLRRPPRGVSPRLFRYPRIDLRNGLEQLLDARNRPLTHLSNRRPVRRFAEHDQGEIAPAS
jgi:hypothetical protein